MSSEEFKLLMSMLEKLDTKFDKVTESLHEGSRRMDALDRNIQLLQQADAKTDSDVSVLKKKMDELEPVRDTVAAIKKLVVVAFALGLLASALPYILKAIK